jgi:hypothetical protein
MRTQKREERKERREEETEISPYLVFFASAFALFAISRSYV